MMINHAVNSNACVPTSIRTASLRLNISPLAYINLGGVDCAANMSIRHTKKKRRAKKKK